LTPFKYLLRNKAKKKKKTIPQIKETCGIIKKCIIFGGKKIKTYSYPANDNKHILGSKKTTVLRKLHVRLYLMVFPRSVFFRGETTPPYFEQRSGLLIFCLFNENE